MFASEKMKVSNINELNHINSTIGFRVSLIQSPKRLIEKEKNIY